jgi:hypothetical protein
MTESISRKMLSAGALHYHQSCSKIFDTLNFLAVLNKWSSRSTQFYHVVDKCLLWDNSYPGINSGIDRKCSFLILWIWRIIFLWFLCIILTLKYIYYLLNSLKAGLVCFVSFHCSTIIRQPKLAEFINYRNKDGDEFYVT